MRHLWKTSSALSKRAARSIGEIYTVGQLTNPTSVRNHVAKTLHVASEDATVRPRAGVPVSCFGVPRHCQQFNVSFHLTTCKCVCDVAGVSHACLLASREVRAITLWIAVLQVGNEETPSLKSCRECFAANSFLDWPD